MTRVRYVKSDEFLTAPSRDGMALLKGGEVAGKFLVGKDAFVAYLKADAVDDETVQRAGDTTEENDASFPFVLSTSSVDRQNDSISAAGWQLSAYRRNPVILFAHDASQLPVARSAATYVVGGNTLKGVARFTDAHEMGRTCAALYKSGFLSAVSVGFRPLKWSWCEDRGGMAIDYAECELLEYSAVPVPAHPDALLEARSLGLDVAPLVEWAEKALASTGGLYLPKAQLEKIAGANGSRVVVDFGKSGAPEVSAEKAPIDIAAIDTMDLIKGIAARGFVFTLGKTEDVTPPADPAPTPAPAPVVVVPPVEPEPAPVVVVDETPPPPPDVVIDDATKTQIRLALRDAFAPLHDALKNARTGLTGRLD